MNWSVLDKSLLSVTIARHCQWPTRLSLGPYEACDQDEGGKSSMCKTIIRKDGGCLRLELGERPVVKESRRREVLFKGLRRRD